jgi:hypothetical protein
MLGRGTTKKRLRNAMGPPLRTLALGQAGLLREPGELEATLADAAPEIRRLKSELSEQDVRALFDEWWREEAYALTPLWERELADPVQVRATMWHWLRTCTLPPYAGGPASSDNPGATRTVNFPDLTESTYLYVETLRPLLPREIDDFPTVQALSDDLVTARGYGFGGVVFDDRGRAVTPGWINADSVAIDPMRSTVAVGATVSHGILGLPLALDLGARDGRNLSQWQGTAPEGLIIPNENLFLGSTAEGWLEMTEIGGSVCSIDIDLAAAHVVVLEWWGSGVAALSLADLPTGRRRLITRLDGIAGNEQARFSADGAWVLVPRWKEPYLVHLASGDFLTLPISGPVAWWPAHSLSSLMLIDQTSVAEPVLCAYDLASANVEQIGPIALPGAQDLPSDGWLVAHLEVSGDGRRVLCMTPFGAPAAHQLEHGSRWRIALFDADELEVDVLTPAFVEGDARIEREHRGARWLERAPSSSFELAPELEGRLVPAATGLAQANFEFVGQDAHDLALYAMRAMVGENGEGDPNILLPEVLRCFSAMRDFMPVALEDVREWVEGINKHFFFAGSTGRLSPSRQEGWRTLREGWEAIDEPAR